MNSTFRAQYASECWIAPSLAEEIPTCGRTDGVRTVEDNEAYTQPWTGEVPMRATEDLIYEYACHEGNYALPGILAGAREQDMG